MNQENKESQRIRLQVYLARCGIASRRKSEEYIASGRVKINGVTITAPGTKVASSDEVRFDDRLVKPEEKLRHLVLNKPAGYLCSDYDEQGRPLAVDLLKPHFDERLFYVGRLDFLSEGLIFFTNDGDFAMKVSHPSTEVEKEYRIDSFDPVSEDILEAYINGIQVEGVDYRIKNYKIFNPYLVHITLIEGKNREIRRLLGHSDIGIRRLTRVRIGSVTIEGLKTGSFRTLSSHEIEIFRKGKNI